MDAEAVGAWAFSAAPSPRQFGLAKIPLGRKGQYMGVAEPGLYEHRTQITRCMTRHYIDYFVLVIAHIPTPASRFMGPVATEATIRQCRPPVISPVSRFCPTLALLSLPLRFFIISLTFGF